MPAVVPRSRARARSCPTCAARSSATGPSAARCCAAIAEHGARRTSSTRRGSSPPSEVERDARAGRSACVLPSRREGYGLVVVEAAAAGDAERASCAAPTTRPPSSSRRASTASWRASADADDLAAAIVRVHEAGPALRESTADWFERNARRLSLDGLARAGARELRPVTTLPASCRRESRLSSEPGRTSSRWRPSSTPWRASTSGFSTPASTTTRACRAGSSSAWECRPRTPTSASAPAATRSRRPA